MDETEFNAAEIVRNAHKLLGAGAVIEMATYGYRGGLDLTDAQRIAIQDAAKEAAALLPDSLLDI